MTPTVRLIALAAALGGMVPTLAGAEAAPGAYLAARQASVENDFEKAVQYYGQALQGDPANPALLEADLVALIGLGSFDRAIPVAQKMVDAGIDSQTAHIVMVVDAAQTDHWSEIFAALEAGRTIGPLVDGLAQSWAYVGEGQMTKALSSFDEVVDAPGLKAFGLYHKALALASVGDFEGADKILSMTPEDGLPHTRRATIAHAQVLSQLGRDADAVSMIDSIFGTDLDPGLSALRASLAAGEVVPYTFVPDAKAGLAEMFLNVAAAIQNENDSVYTLLYARAAEQLSSGDAEIILQVGQTLDKLGRYDLANATYSRVARDDPAFHAAELGRAESLRKAGKLDAAIEVLQQLARSHGDMPLVQATLGDLLRQNRDMAGANAAYGKAIDLYGADNPQSWLAHYTRGITYERLGQWPEAEADFRTALKLNPGQPQVLNYLGYSLVERKENLDEALKLIQQAAAAQPDNGAIIDSLGWAEYRMGRYQDAIVDMEKAILLEPVDPVVNDHLGDVLWAVGRETEAKFQWQRALSFNPEEADAARIRRKLQIGLDAVLAEEGADPLRVARDDR